MTRAALLASQRRPNLAGQAPVGPAYFKCNLRSAISSAVFSA